LGIRPFEMYRETVDKGWDALAVSSFMDSKGHGESNGEGRKVILFHLN